MADRDNGQVSAPSWSFSDAWVLAAIGDGRRPSKLRDIVGAADYYNHAIPTEDELVQGLRRLMASGLVREEERKFAATPAGRTLWNSSSGNGYDRVESLLEGLEHTPLVEGRHDLPPCAVHEAYRRYIRWFPWMWWPGNTRE